MPTKKPPPEQPGTPPVRLLLRHKLEAQTEKLALRALLNAAHLLGLATGVFLRQLRGLNDPLAETAARLKEAQLQAKVAWEIVEILGARLDKLGEQNSRRRPYYTPVQRFRILEIKNLLGWNRNFAAHLFRVCSNNTISNWEKHADPSSNTVGSPLDAVPPVVRLQDVTRRLIQSMLQLGIGGEDMVARTLARAGWLVSARSVRRIGKEAKTPSPTPPPPPPIRAKPTTPVVARFVGHVLMMDVSVVRSFLGGELYLAAVFDAFSRVPIALATYQTKPGSAAMAKLLKAAAKIVSTPKYVLTDRGCEFTGRLFAKTVSRLGAIHRFGSVDCLFATARIERFWRSIKHLAALRLHPPLTIEDLYRRLETAATYYLVFRPHQGLQGATPAEAFLGLEPASVKAVKPPRGRPGEGPLEPPFVIDFLDRESRTFPFLKDRLGSRGPCGLGDRRPSSVSTLDFKGHAPSTPFPSLKLDPLFRSKEPARPASRTPRTPIAGLPNATVRWWIVTYRRRELAALAGDALETLPVVVIGTPSIRKDDVLAGRPGLSRKALLPLDDFAILEAARRDPGLVAGEEPVTIDEAQRCPELFIAEAGRQALRRPYQTTLVS